MITRSGGLAVGLVLAFAGLGSAPAASQDAAEELKAIDLELQQEGKALRETLKDVDPEQEQVIYTEYLQNVLPEFAARYAEVARTNRGSAVALEAWTKVVGLASRGMRNPLASEALRTVASEHLESPKLASLAQSLRYAVPSIDESDVIATLRAVGDGSPHREVQAAALYNLGAVLGDERPAGDPRIEEARVVLGKLSAFGDLQFREETTYADAARSFLFALDNLVVGKPCPDFSAVDAEGAAFKLSDYKGKVVLVDFWGFW